MIVQYIRNLLYTKGYKSMETTGIDVLYREAEQAVYVVSLSDIIHRISEKDYLALQQKLGFAMAKQFRKEIRFLHLIVHETSCFDEEALQLTKQMANAWHIAKDDGKVFLFEYQISEFDELYELFEKFLPKYVSYNKKANVFKFTPANLCIVLLNIVVFLIIIIMNGNIYAVYDTKIMLSMGALHYDTFVAGAWYQLVSSIFLHFGLAHLMSNMVLLLYAGCELERRVGSVGYILIYFSSGVLGNVVSLIYHQCVGEEVVSAGASGAVFGVIGALLTVLIIHHVKTPNLSPVRLIIMIGITIIYGLTNGGIDNAAHIGGLFVGILVEFLLSKISQYGKLEEVKFMR